jgi:hypothetical protein
LGAPRACSSTCPSTCSPAGWRLVDRPWPGCFARTCSSLWRADLDELAEAYDGYVRRPLKTQVCRPVDPWPPVLELNRGERVLTRPRRDRGTWSTRSPKASAVHARRCHGGWFPGAEVILQVDEPALPAVLAGELPTASGYGRIRAIDRGVAVRGIREVLAAHPGATVVHCCHPYAPIPLLRECGPGALALDLTGASPARWESIAATLDGGIGLYAGVFPTDGTGSVRAAVRAVLDGFEQAGLGAQHLTRLTVTPACGLAGLSQVQARGLHQRVVDAARELSEVDG